MPRLPSNLPPAGSQVETALVGWWDACRAAGFTGPKRYEAKFNELTINSQRRASSPAARVGPRQFEGVHSEGTKGSATRPPAAERGSSVSHVHLGADAPSARTPPRNPTQFSVAPKSLHDQNFQNFVRPARDDHGQPQPLPERPQNDFAQSALAARKLL